MGKRLSVSQPAVIDTELTPLTDHFDLVPNGATEQWYYENAGLFAPNRQLTPLIIVPTLVAVDTETNTRYTPSFYSVTWKELRYVDGSGWVETEITNTTNTSNYDYVKIGNNLKVNRNHSDSTHGITIKCEVVYIDPRDVGIRYSIPETSILLTTNRDATRIYPTIDVSSEETQSFNPLNGGSHLFTFNATADWSSVPETDGSNAQFEWYGVDSSGSEVLVNTLPFYVSGQNTSALVINALYGENITVILRIKNLVNNVMTLLPPKVFRTVLWRIPRIEAIVSSDRGQAVRVGTGDFTFRTIVNTNGQALSDTVVAANLRFHWISRKAEQASAQEVNRGWGLTAIIPAADLMNVNNGVLSSSLVRSEVYVLGPYQKVIHSGNNVTYNGQQVYCRTTF